MRYFSLSAISLLLLLVVVAAQAQTVTAPQSDAIRQMGQLNGVALNCRFLQETRRMKKALVLTLPKRRQLGELFDMETHNAFLKFIEDGQSCPGERTFSERVDAAILVLDQAFAAQ